ncbi:MAG: haloacid dehalogenase-like hydrolase, partial [Verrucomicrobiota bacterium]
MTIRPSDDPTIKPTTATKKLLLWDIDGTLVHTGKAGEFAIGVALKRKFGKTGAIDQVDFRGRTDRRICHQLLEFHGVEPTQEAVEEMVQAYLDALKEELPNRQGLVFPGILEILEVSHERDDLVNALLTGNAKRGAELKLSYYHIWNYFEFGAFADDSSDRNELGPVALERAKDTLNLSFEGKDVLVIGDTPHDIACGNVIGAQTVAVATGGYSYE